jgi:hypothetical protein
MPISIIEYLERGPSTSKEIQAATGLSQSTIARQIKRVGDRIIPIPAGRSVMYAATCNAFNSGDKIPLSIIDDTGKPLLAAYVRPLIHGGYFVESTINLPPLLLGDNQIGLYDDLPYFLLDLKPQGFLGRQIAKRIASQCDDFPYDPRNWTPKHIGRYLLSNGDDLPGNFIFGEQALLRIRQRPLAVSEKTYPELAQKVIEGEVPSSSAGGEQPKFTAFNGDLESHVIVKFSPKGDNEISARWRDILITEYHAAEVVNRYIFPSAVPRLIDLNGRLFLETQRFDRIGALGRASMISLQIIDAEFTGLGSNWSSVMRDLLDNDLVSNEDVFHAESLWYFGQLINNSDMHLGNLSLSINDSVFKLLPIYDMCSMGFAPKSSGEMPSLAFEAPDICEAISNENQCENILRAAYTFWENVSKDGRTSDQFRTFLQQGNPVERLRSID